MLPPRPSVLRVTRLRVAGLWVACPGVDGWEPDYSLGSAAT